MKRTLAILPLFLLAWSPQAFPQAAQKMPTEIYKCSKTEYQSDLCASGASKPLKTRDAKGIEAPKGRAPEYVRPAPAPVVLIPHTPSKPLTNSQLPYTPTPTNTTPCRSANGGSC